MNNWQSQVRGDTRNTVWRSLKQLFEAPIEADDTIARAVLQSVVGPKQIDFSRIVSDFTDNAHLLPLVKPAVSPVVWENEDKESLKTVLDPIETEGQELLFE